MNPVLIVIAGSGGFKLVDAEGVIYGSSPDQDEAELFAKRLNERFENLIEAAEHLGGCAIVSCQLCKTYRLVVQDAKAVRS